MAFGQIDTGVGELELWLEEWTRALPDESVYWAPNRHAGVADWIAVRSVEHLAVLISTARRRDNNVCFVSDVAAFGPRTTNVIGLVTRPQLGWAVVANAADDGSLDVQRNGYNHSNYDSFSAVAAAEISWAWVVTGGLPAGLTGRRRGR